MGRTHRDGQPEDVVTFEIYMGCREQFGSFWRAYERARYMQDSMTTPHKLCYSDILVPTLADSFKWKGPRWDENK
jgi:hypothetical protein